MESGLYNTTREWRAGGYVAGDFNILGLYALRGSSWLVQHPWPFATV